MSNKPTSDPAPDMVLAREIFATLQSRTNDGNGVTRSAYGAGEQIAHDVVRNVAESLALEIDTDNAGSLYLTLPGEDRSAKRIVIGSHLDSVPRGGNYDGAAGVVCGLSAVSGLIKAGITPRADIVVMGIRSEEAVWFANNYTGSKMALGRLDPGLLDSLTHSATGRTLAESIADAGFNPDGIRRREAYLDPSTIAAFIEPHIEQGPVLETEGIPVGIVTGIRGNFRYRNCRCVGEYGHSGAVPLKMRKDAVAATVEFLHRLNLTWREHENAGEDLVLTCGTLSTDASMHGFSRISGDVRFTLDVRSHSNIMLEKMHESIAGIKDDVCGTWRVDMAFDDIAQSPPAKMNVQLVNHFREVAQTNGIEYVDIASGGGHDAAEFAAAGVPTAMIFIRNDHGSHNPRESMSLEDLGQACSLLIGYLVKHAWKW
jgi:beta-ureidopropionase / N-carbamoyl-L-amino-acid hydrolase